MYSRKYPGNLLKEFDLNNFSPEPAAPIKPVAAKVAPTINENIKDMDI
jgi:hypothetical protein